MGQAFYKRLAVSKGGALVALRRVRNFLFRRALRKGLNLQNDPVDRFAKRGNPAREGAPLVPASTDYPSSEQEGTAYLQSVMAKVCCRLTASQSLFGDLVCTPIRRGLPFARARCRGLRSMSGRYSHGIDNPPTLRRSSFPQQVVQPVGVPYCKTRSGIPRDPTLVGRNLRFNRADPPLHCEQPSPQRCVLLSPQGLTTLRGPH